MSDVGFVGEVPIVSVAAMPAPQIRPQINIEKREHGRSTEIWSVPDYRAAESPGLINVERFLEVLRPPRGSTILDAGCGTGAAGRKLQQEGMVVTYLDITSAGFEGQLPSSFIEAPLWAEWRGKGRRWWDYGFCCDVLEHIPIEFTMLSVARLISACSTVWLHIALEPDRWGPMVLNEPLHQTVKPFSWWLDRLYCLGDVREARDLIHSAMFVIVRK